MDFIYIRRDLRVQTKIGEPVPAKDAFTSNDDIRSKRFHGFKKRQACYDEARHGLFDLKYTDTFVLRAKQFHSKIYTVWCRNHKAFFIKVPVHANTFRKDYQDSALQGGLNNTKLFHLTFSATLQNTGEFSR